MSRNWLKFLKFMEKDFKIYYCISILVSPVKIIATTHKKNASNRSHNGIFAENQRISL